MKRDTRDIKCGCCIVLRTGEVLDSSLGDRKCSEISRIELCAIHAAAPDLLAALKLALRHMQMNHDSSEEASNKTMRELGKAIAEVSSAIAKATG